MDDVENFTKQGVREFKSVPKELLDKHYVVCFIFDIYSGKKFKKGVIDAEYHNYFSENSI